MSDATVKLLEDRVRRVLARLKELSSERTRLETEIHELRERLERLGRSTEASPVETDELLSALKGAIQELRGD